MSDQGVPLKRTLTGPEPNNASTMAKSSSGFRIQNPFSSFSKKGEQQPVSSSEPALHQRKASGAFGHIRQASMNNLSAFIGNGAPQQQQQTPSQVSSNLVPGSPPLFTSTQPIQPAFTFTMEDYEMGQCIGQGSSALVYLGTHIPSGTTVSLKVIDLDMFERNQIDELRREIQIMSLSRHPNLLPVYGSFVSGSKLFIVTPLLAAGSCLDMMRTRFKEGFGDESVIATILKQALMGLDYLHKNGLIHRDVKAGNLLVDSDGLVQLADFGVSSSLMETGERKGMRKTFVGTPSWMSPEVMEQCGYDYKADIWSFGITAIELATGHAPYAKYPPIKVLMLTLQNEPPTLDRKNNKYSKAFKDMVDLCLQKDPSKRPTTDKLLQHPFFKSAKKPSTLISSVIETLPPLTDRNRRLKQKPESGEQERGVSWDFTDTERSLSKLMQSAKVSDPIREEGETPLPPFKLESKRAIRFAPLDSTEEIPSVPSAFTQQQQQQGAVEATTTDGESPVSNLTHTSNQSSQSEASGGPTLASSASQQQLQKQQQQQLAQLPLQVKKGRFSVVEKSLSSSGSSPLEPGVPRAGSPKMDSGPVPVQQQQHQVGGSPMSANPKEDSQKGLQGLAQQQDQQQQQQQAQQQQQQPPVSTLERKMGRFAIQQSTTSPRMTEFPSLSSSGPTTTIGGKSSSASCMEPSGLSSLRTVQGQDQGSVLGIITTVAEGAGGKSSRFTVSSETGPTTATAGKGSDSTAMEVDTLSVVAQQTVPGVDMGLVGRLLKGPELVGVSNAEEREGLLQRHVLEQQRLIESLLSALSVGQQGPMMTRRHVVVGLGLESGSSSSKSGGQEETSVAEDKNRGKN